MEVHKSLLLSLLLQPVLVLAAVNAQSADLDSSVQQAENNLTPREAAALEDDRQRELNMQAEEARKAKEAQGLSSEEQKKLADEHEGQEEELDARIEDAHPTEPGFVEKLSFKGGYSYAFSNSSDKDGGAIGPIIEPDENGLGLELEVVFDTSFSGFFKPYMDVAYLKHDDRKFIIPGIGLRHDIVWGNHPNWEPFYAFGLGYNFAEWTESPAPGLTGGDHKGESLNFTAKGGIDFYLSEHLAVDLTARWDAYHIGTTIIDGGSTTLDDNGSLSLMAGVVWRFHKRTRIAAADADHDGVVDVMDLCNGTGKHVPVNEAGCPQYRFQITLAIDFDEYESSHLKNHPTFDSISFLQNNPEYHLEIVGYTDSTGSDGVNLKLSRQRAQESMKVLTDAGISANRIKIIGRGESEPLVAGDSAAAHSKNRRVQLEFYRVN